MESLRSMARSMGTEEIRNALLEGVESRLVCGAMLDVYEERTSGTAVDTLMAEMGM